MLLDAGRRHLVAAAGVAKIYCHRNTKCSRDKNTNPSQLSAQWSVQFEKHVYTVGEREGVRARSGLGDIYLVYSLSYIQLIYFTMFLVKIPLDFLY